MVKSWVRAVLIAIVAGLVVWAPWISAPVARGRAEAAFVAAQEGIIDGCGITCKGCGAVAARKVIFGRKVTIEYACSLLPADLPQYHQRGEFFVSTIGTVHRLP